MVREKSHFYYRHACKLPASDLLPLASPRSEQGSSYLSSHVNTHPLHLQDSCYATPVHKVTGCPWPQADMAGDPGAAVPQSGCASPQIEHALASINPCPASMWVSPERKARGAYPETLSIPESNGRSSNRLEFKQPTAALSELKAERSETLVVSDLFLATRICLLIVKTCCWSQHMSIVTLNKLQRAGTSATVEFHPDSSICLHNLNAVSGRMVCRNCNSRQLQAYCKPSVANQTKI